MSKGLESLKDIFNHIYNKATTYDEDVKLANDRDTIEKELKALDIIKDKNVDIYSIKVCINVEHYNGVIKSKNFNNNYSYEIWYELTQEEWDLLKEVLKND